MSSEESNKISNQTPSQDSPYKEDEWYERLYNDLLDTYNDNTDNENFWDMWDKEYALRQLRRRLELDEDK